jgi:tetratricopeptide (TPR) repeat protein
MKLKFDELYKMAKKADREDRPAEAVELFKSVFAFNQSLSAYARLRLADNLRVIGRFAEAEKVFAEIPIDDVPTDKLWLVDLHRGQLFLDRREFGSAVSSFERALERNPASTVPYVYLAGAHARLEEPMKAIEVLQRGIKAEGDRDEVYLNLGYNYRTLGQYQLAAEAFSNALEVTPDYKEAKEAFQDVTSALSAVEIEAAAE